MLQYSAQYCLAGLTQCSAVPELIAYSHVLLVSIVVSIPACHAGDRDSTGRIFFFKWRGIRN